MTPPASDAAIEKLRAALHIYACKCAVGRITYCRRFDKEDCGWVAAQALMTDEERAERAALEHRWSEEND